MIDDIGIWLGDNPLVVLAVFAGLLYFGNKFLKNRNNRMPETLPAKRNKRKIYEEYIQLEKQIDDLQGQLSILKHEYNSKREAE